LKIRRREEERDERTQEGVPDVVLRSIDAAIEPIRRLEQDIEQPPSEVLWQLMPKEDDKGKTVQSSMEWDVFICHASEDKEEFVRPLATALQERGLNVWFDELTLTVGDSLRRSIDQGLAHSKFGVVVLSKNFLQKEWPQKELDGLFAREIEGVKIILPVWHNITAEEIRKYSPMLADRLATNSDAGIDNVVADLMRAVGKNGPPAAPRQTEIPPPSEAQIEEWHELGHARYLKLLKERGQEWPVSVEDNHYQLSFEVLSEGATPSISLNEVKQNLGQAENAVKKDVWTGWSMFHQFDRPEIKPYVIVESIGGTEIEILEACILGQAHSSITVPDFWRVSTTGAGIITRPYREDRQVIELGGEPLQPGTFLSPRTLVRELYEFTCYAREIAVAHPTAARIAFLGTWWGLEGRKINDGLPGIDWHERTSHTDSRTVSTVAEIDELGDGIFELVASLANPVLRLFDDLEVGSDWIESIKPGFRTI